MDLTDGTGRASEDASTPSFHDDDSRHIPTLSMPAPGATATELSSMRSISSRTAADCKNAEAQMLQTRTLSAQTTNEGDVHGSTKTEKKLLNLVDLPIDVLKEVLKEITHTNDLTSLALTHSALHRLVTPLIYSRFDIVWPDVNATSEPRTGVDALTYGLATLCMAEDVFGEAPWQKKAGEAQHNLQSRSHRRLRSTQLSDTQIRQRRGNYYAQFIKKFSLGNGPSDWVREYLIHKESGKMLGTLVALAVARMRSLETFVWDMPTGILRDVWASLSYLGDRQDGEDSHLQKVWVRFHDNGHTSPSPQHNPDPVGHGLYSLNRVEHPNFSVLPPLKSLSVLEIDELQYLDEMSVLIGRSKDVLSELRVGIAEHAEESEWVTSWDGEGAEQIDPYVPTRSAVTIGGKRLGGVLGILTGSFYDIREKRALTFRPKRLRRRSSAINLNQSSVAAQAAPNLADNGQPLPFVNVENSHPSTSMPIAKVGPSSHDMVAEQVSNPKNVPIGPGLSVKQAPFHHDLVEQKTRSNELQPMTSTTTSHTIVEQAAEVVSPQYDFAIDDEDTNPRFSGKLGLRTLELERVPLSAMSVLEHAIDWTKLTSLTLLGCSHHEQLWKLLRSAYGPQDERSKHRRSRSAASVSKTKDLQSNVPTLQLKKIHTDNVSSALISFIKDCLPPNSLESIYLQDTRSYLSSVDIGSIFRGIIKAHKSSLRRVLIDSTDKLADERLTVSTRWRKWTFGRDMIAFITSGKMPLLRELGMSIDKCDWHYFLQRLPSIPHLRSLYLPHVGHIHGPPVVQTDLHYDPRELAMQVIDIIVLKPAIELCYMGIMDKCFEIQEANGKDGRYDGQRRSLGEGTEDAMDDDEAGEDDEDDEEEDDDDDDGQDRDSGSEGTLSDSEGSEETDSDDEFSSGTIDGTRLRLREILFYDDKVSIFKARHGRIWVCGRDVQDAL